MHMCKYVCMDVCACWQKNAIFKFVVNIFSFSKETKHVIWLGFSNHILDKSIG